MKSIDNSDTFTLNGKRSFLFFILEINSSVDLAFQGGVPYRIS